MRTLDEWLRYIELQHPKSIALGLERVADVFSKMSLKLDCAVVTV